MIERQPRGRPMRAGKEQERHIKGALGALSDKIKKIHRKKGKQRDEKYSGKYSQMPTLLR